MVSYFDCNYTLEKQVNFATLRGFIKSTEKLIVETSISGIPQVPQAIWEIRPADL